MKQKFLSADIQEKFSAYNTQTKTAMKPIFSLYFPETNPFSPITGLEFSTSSSCYSIPVKSSLN
ncbi:hypothetical protein AOB46_13975 [Chryseobacterium indologenes]|uniref:Uncharacterized protein n=1 Tax=Chryseobacterium indologenes TaxID=253 RepID=A0A0N1KS12_CHRID|nr:hypothetical protein AOB46_13975 [Chryseobacterium indologenes]